MARKHKIGRIEDDTPLLPWVVADSVIGEVEQCHGELRNRDAIADRLADRADRIYQRNERFRKTMRSRGNTGRDMLYSFMRHWLSADLKKTDPTVYRKLPREFAWPGLPLRCGGER